MGVRSSFSFTFSSEDVSGTEGFSDSFGSFSEEGEDFSFSELSGFEESGGLLDVLSGSFSEGLVVEKELSFSLGCGED
ncbi:MAG TPA: hypothetical protein PK777_17310 [Thermoguttaceae bacterium]|nr:hypothetical protein [Thermoguttaceae bacterium]